MASSGDVWYTGMGDGDGSTCRNAARRLLATSGELSPVIYGPGKSLFNFASAGGSIWASDIGRTIYRVDLDSAAISPSLTLNVPADINRLVAAFGSVWVLGGESGQLVRMDVSQPD